MAESSNDLSEMDSRLYIAADEGNVDELQKLIREVGVDIFRQVTGVGNSVLHIAVSRGDHRFIYVLLEFFNTCTRVELGFIDLGLKFLMAKNSDGNSALHLAAFYGHHQLVEKILQLLGEDDILQSFNGEGNTALHEAAKRGNDRVVDILLRHSSSLIHRGNLKLESALFIASQGGHINTVGRLLTSIREAGGEISLMQRADGQTPLHRAVFYRHTGVVETLLYYEESKDMATLTDKSKRTVMHMFVLSSPVPGFMGLDWTDGRDSNKIAYLLLAGKNSLCYKQDNKGKTPLHMAVEWAKYDLVRILLMYGRDCIEVVDEDGRKPLHLAVINAERITRTINIVEFYKFKNMLLSLMSWESLNHYDNRGRTPLHIARENIEKDAALYESIIKVLQNNGAPVTPEILEETRKMGAPFTSGSLKGKEKTSGSLEETERREAPMTSEILEHIRRLELSTANSNIKAKNISINAVLVATVSFAAAFTLPGGLVSKPGQKPKAVFFNTFLFKLFVICDAFSFCTSITSAILLQYLGLEGQQDLSQVVLGINLLWFALLSLVVAFGAALHMVTTPSPWLAGTVWALVSLVPVTIYVARFNSKRFIFGPVRYKFWFALGFPFAAIAWRLFIISYLIAGLFHKVARWIKKLLKQRDYRGESDAVLFHKMASWN